MANAKIKHEFTIVRGRDKQSAYLLIWQTDEPDPRAPGGRVGRYLSSAWTTLAAAKRTACEVVERQRMHWTEEEEESVTLWTSACVQVVKQ